MPENRSNKQSIWRTILNCFRTFCMETSIHGLNHIVVPRRHWIERFVWVAVTSVGVWGAWHVTRGQYGRYRDSPTVVTLERETGSGTYHLPAVTTCYDNRVSDEKLVKTIKSLWNVEPGSDRFEYYKRFVDTVANSDVFHLEGYEQFHNDSSLQVDLMQLVVEVLPEQNVKASSSEEFPLRWTPVMTELGACYTTNSIAVADAAIVKPPRVSWNTSFELPFSCSYCVKALCYFIFEVTSLVHFYVHSPYDVADTAERASCVYPSLNRFSELSAAETRAGPGVRALAPARRACLYTDESTPTADNYRQVYSTHMCRSGCRSRLAVRLCGCRPFYYFYEAGTPCTTVGMWCLARFAKELTNFAGTKCSCSQLCVDTLFRETFVQDQFWDKGPFQGRGSLRVTVRAPKFRYRRDIVFHFEDLVVSIGGAAGLFLGASFISFVEIVYFALERFAQLFATRKKNASKNDYFYNK